MAPGQAYLARPLAPVRNYYPFKSTSIIYCPAHLAMLLVPLVAENLRRGIGNNGQADCNPRYLRAVGRFSIR